MQGEAHACLCEIKEGVQFDISWKSQGQWVANSTGSPILPMLPYQCGDLKHVI